MFVVGVADERLVVEGPRSGTRSNCAWNELDDVILPLCDRFSAYLNARIGAEARTERYSWSKTADGKRGKKCRENAPSYEFLRQSRMLRQKMNEGYEGYERMPWEGVDRRYFARIQFLEDHTDAWGRERATTMSHVWSNVYYDGNRYPDAVQALVARWEPRLDALPTFDDVKSKTKPPPTLEREEEDEEEKRSEYPVENLSDVPDAVLEIARRALINDEDVEEKPISLFYACAQKSKFTVKFNEETVDGSGGLTMGACLNGVPIDSGRGANKKDARRAACEQSLRRLVGLQIQLGIRQLKPWRPQANSDTMVTKDDLKKSTKTSDVIPESNIGNRMLKKMGWDGDKGLGREGAGLIDPIATMGQVSRAGLGASGLGQTIDRRLVKARLEEFVQRDADDAELTFSSELTKEDRVVVHEVAQMLHLRHRSFNENGARYIAVSKMTNAAEAASRDALLRKRERDVYENEEDVSAAAAKRPAGIF